MVSTYPIVNFSKHSKKFLSGTKADPTGPNPIICGGMNFGLYIPVSMTSLGFSTLLIPRVSFATNISTVILWGERWTQEFSSQFGDSELPDDRKQEYLTPWIHILMLKAVFTHLENDAIIQIAVFSFIDLIVL